MILNVKQVKKYMKKEGFFLHRLKGSYYIFKKDSQTVVIAIHNKGIHKNIIKRHIKRESLKNGG